MRPNEYWIDQIAVGTMDLDTVKAGGLCALGGRPELPDQTWDFAQFDGARHRALRRPVG
jgi:hypothetical protein